jgi:hypothetical protein
MKNIKQIRESYDFVTDKSVRDQRNLDALVEAGLFEERKLPVLKKILESSADRMSGSEKRFVVSLLESLIVQFANQDLIEAKGDYLSKYDPRGPKGQPSDSELPPVIILKRKAIRVYPDHQKVALYYAQTIDRYVSIPYGGNHVMTVNEETDDDKKRPVPQKKKKQVPLEKREDLTMADLPAVRRYLMKSAFTSQDPLRAAMINLGTYSGIKSRLKKASRMKKPERIEPQFTDIPKKSVPKVSPTTASSPVAKAAEGVWKQRRLEESFKDRLEILREQALEKSAEVFGAERFMRKPDISDPSNQNRLFQNKNVFKKKPSIRKELKNLQQKVDRTKRVSPVDAKQKPGRADGAREKFRKAAQERIARKAAEVKPDKVKGKSLVPSILKNVGPFARSVLKFGITKNPYIGAIADAKPLNAPEVEWLKNKETTKKITAREPGSSQDLAKQTKKRDAAAAATMLKDRGIKKTTTSFLNAPDKPVPQISTTQEPVVSSAPSALTRQLSVQQQAQAQQPSQAQALASQPDQAPARQSNKDRKEEGKNKLSKDDKSKRRSSGPKDRKLRRTRPGRFNMPDISLPSMPPGAKEPGPNYQFGLKPAISTPTPVTNTAAVGKWIDIISRKANQAMTLNENQTKDDEDETGSATRTADDKPIYNFRRRPRVGISKATGTDAAVQAWLNRIGRQANLAMLRQQDQQESVLHTIQSMVENNIAESTIIIGEQPITINNTVAKKIVSIHESMNKKNKKKMEEMLNESASSFNKVLTFAVRH